MAGQPVRFKKKKPHATKSSPCFVEKRREEKVLEKHRPALKFHILAALCYAVEVVEKSQGPFSLTHFI
jgi:hypothetical protein